MIYDNTQDPALPTGIQDPQDPVNPNKGMMKDRLMRMIKARAEGLSKPLLDDRGRVVIPAIEDRSEALKTSLGALSGWMAGNPEHHKSYLDYVNGRSDDMPPGWLVDETPQVSRETMRAQATIKRHEQFKKDHPVYTGFQEWFGDPVTSFAAQRLQVPVDVATGVINLFGAEINPIDVKAGFGALLESAVTGNEIGESYENQQDYAAIRAGSRSTGARILNTGAEIAGLGKALAAKGGALSFPGKVLEGGGKAAERVWKLGEKALGKSSDVAGLGQRLAHAAGAFGAYEAIVATGEGGEAIKGLFTAEGLGDRVKGYGHGLLAGVMIGGAGEVVRVAATSLLSKRVADLTRDEKELYNAILEWGKSNKFTRQSGEAKDAFMKRLTTGYAQAGAPGLKVPFDRMKIIAGRSGLEAAGFSALDERFQEAAWRIGYDSWVLGKPVEAADVNTLWETYLGNALGVAGMHVPLNQIPGLQRLAKQGPTGFDPLFQGKDRVTGQDPAAELVKGVDPMATKESLQKAMLDQAKADLEGAKGLERVRQVEEAAPGDVTSGEQKAAERAKQEADRAELDKPLAEQVVEERTAQSEADRARAALHDLLFERVTGRDKVEQAWAEKIEIEPTDMMRLGWRYTEDGGIEIPGTKYRMDIAEDGIRLSKPMADALGMPTRIKTEPLKPAEGAVLKEATEGRVGLPTDAATIGRRLGDLVRRASLISALRAKSLLPGVEVSAEGVKAEVGGERPPVMRTIRMGEVYEKPLTPGSVWEPAKKFPARGKDPLPRDQVDAIRTLQTVMDHRTDLSPADRALLSTVLETLDTVSREKDRSVAEALEFLPELLPDIATAEPIVAGNRIQMLAEALTTKSPQLFVEAVEQQATEHQREVKRRERIMKSTSEMEFDEGAKATVKVRPDVAKFLKPFVPSTSEFGKQIGKAAETTDRSEITATPEDLKRVQRTLAKFIPQARSRLVGSDLKRFNQAQQAAEAKIEELAHRFGVRLSGEEGGALIRGDSTDVVDAVSDAIKRPTLAAIKFLGAITSLVTDNTISRKFATDIGGRIREVMPELGAKVFEQEAATQRRMKGYNQQLLSLGKHANKRIPELEKVEWTEPNEMGEQFGFDHRHVFKETDLMQRFGLNRSQLSERAIEALKAHDAATESIREDYHNLTGKRSKHAPKKVLTRQPTAILQDAMMHGSPLAEVFYRGVAEANGTTAEAVKKAFAEEGWTDASRLKKVDPIETARAFRYAPDQVKLADGTVFKFFETDLLAHAKRMVSNGAKRMAMIEVFGEGGYEKIMATVPPQHRDLVVKGFRLMGGMAPDKSMIDPRDTKTYQAIEGFHQIANVLAAAKLTMAPFYNVTEVLGTASVVLGPARMSEATARAWVEASSGKLGDAMQKLVEEGGFTPHVPEWLSGAGETSLSEKIRIGSRTATTAFMIPFEASQTVTDVAVRYGLGRFVTDLSEGRGSRQDKQALRSLWGFGEAEAARLTRGEGTAKEYENLLLTGLPRITRRGDLPINKSEFAAKRNLTKWIRFTGFFQRQMATTRRLTLDMKNAKTPAEAHDAALQFAKMVGFNSFAFLAGQSLVSWIKGGGDEVMRMWLEAAESPGRTLGGAMLGSLFGGAGSIMAGAAYSAFTAGDDLEEVVGDASRMIFPLSEMWGIGQFAAAEASRAMGKPVGSGPYSGKTPLQMLGYFVGKEIPAVRTAMDGMFGLGATYLGTDPQIENALKANYRWNGKNVSMPEFPAPDEDRAKFLDAMRAGLINLKEKGGYNYIEAERVIREALPGDDDSIRQSLLSRRVLSGAQWTKLTPKQQGAKLRSLGEPTVELLRGYDTALEILANRFKPLNLFK